MQLLWKSFVLPGIIIVFLLMQRLVFQEGVFQANFLKEFSGSYLDIVSIFLMNLVFAWSFFKSKNEAPRISKILLLFLLSFGSYLLISFIQTSMPLALGMLGALSIIRFRTPIKDPLELVYIFSSVVVGVGFGAKQVDLTIIGFISLFIVVEFLKSIESRDISQLDTQSATLLISFRNKEVDAKQVEETLFKKYNIKLNKFDLIGDECRLAFKVNDGEAISILQLTEDLKKEVSGSFNLHFSSQPHFEVLL